MHTEDKYNLVDAILVLEVWVGVWNCRFEGFAERFVGDMYEGGRVTPTTVINKVPSWRQDPPIGGGRLVWMKGTVSTKVCKVHC